MTLLLVLLIVLILLSGAGSGYGYYTGGAYASPLGIVGAVLLILLLCWLFFGGPVWTTAPPTVP